MDNTNTNDTNTNGSEVVTLVSISGKPMGTLTKGKYVMTNRIVIEKNRRVELICKGLYLLTAVLLAFCMYPTIEADKTFFQYITIFIWVSLSALGVRCIVLEPVEKAFTRTRNDTSFQKVED